MLSYTLLIMSAFLIDEHIIMLSDNWFTKIIAVSISIRELISITENVEQVTGRNLLSTIVNVIKKGWKKGFEDEINKNRKP